MKYTDIPDDIFNDSYEKYPMGPVREAYQAGRIEQKALTPHTDEDMLSFHELCRDTPGKTWQELLEQYKKSKS